jgi:hypothetical protein
MKPLVILGVVLLIIGAILLAYQGISYVTTEKVVDAGPVQIEASKEKTIPIPPIIGVTAMVAGILCIVLGATRKTA